MSLKNISENTRATFFKASSMARLSHDERMQMVEFYLEAFFQDEISESRIDRLEALLRRALVHCDVSQIEGGRTLYNEIQEALKEE